MPTAARPPSVSLATLARPLIVVELSSMLRSESDGRHYKRRKGKPARSAGGSRSCESTLAHSVGNGDDDDNGDSARGQVLLAKPRWKATKSFLKLIRKAPRRFSLIWLSD